MQIGKSENDVFCCMYQQFFDEAAILNFEVGAGEKPTTCQAGDVSVYFF